MPQLTFDRDICPKRISVSLVWDQLVDAWSVEVFTYSQSGKLQSTFSNGLPRNFATIELCMTLERCLEDWIDVTPGYAIAMLAKSIKALRLVEVPVGLRPLIDPIQAGASGREPKDRVRRHFPPTNR